MVSKENKAFKLKVKAGKIISVIQKLGVFQAFFQNVPKCKITGMTWQEGVANLLIRDKKLKLSVEKEKDVFTAFFDLKSARRIKGLGLSQESAIVDLLKQSGVEIFVHYEVQRLEDLKTG